MKLHLISILTMANLHCFCLKKHWLSGLKRCLPVANKEGMHKRSWSWYIWTTPGWSLTNSWYWGLISSTYTAAGCRKRKGMVFPTMIMKIHSRKCVGSWHFARYRWAIPVIVVWCFWNSSAGVWGGGMYRSKVSYIWAGMTSRRHSGMFSKNSMLSQYIMICDLIIPVKTNIFSQMQASTTT